MILYATKGICKMNKKEVLENKIIEIENENSDIKGKIARDIFIALASAIGLIIPAFVLKKIYLDLSFPLLSAVSIIPTMILYDVAIRKNMLDQNKKQINHLKNIDKKGIKKSKKLDEARYEKIEELKNSQDNMIKKDKLLSYLTTLPIVSWLGASALTLFTTNAFIVSLASVLILSGISIASAKKEKEILDLDTRITNIENDLMLEPLFGYSKTSNNESTKKVEERKKTSPTVEKVKQDNESLVERYLRDLEKMKSQEEKGKVYRKGN